MVAVDANAVAFNININYYRSIVVARGWRLAQSYYGNLDKDLAIALIFLQ